MLNIGVLLGDDIGLEVVPECVRVMKAAAKKTGPQVEWRDLPIGKRGKVIAEAKHLTADLGGKASTSRMGDAVAAAV